VNVLDQQNCGPLGDEVGQELGPGVLEAIAGGKRVQIAGDVQTEREPKNLPGAEPVERHLWRIAFQEAQVLSQHLAQRPIRGSCSVREAAAGSAQGLWSLLGQLLPELADESCLADACIAENRHEARPPLVDRRPVGITEALEFPIPANERAREAADAARPNERERTHNTSRYNPLRLALRFDQRWLLELESAARRGDRALADEDRSRGGGLLQPSSDVDRITADEGASGSSLPHDDLTRVDADPQLEPPLDQLRQPPLHRQRSVQRPLGMILKRARRAEAAITASPANFSIVPPARSISSVITS
jgi:hypothetical protein